MSRFADTPAPPARLGVRPRVLPENGAARAVINEPLM